MKRTTVSERALILAPRGRDAAIASAILNGAGVAAEACASLPDLVDELDRGAALVVVTEEALATADLGPLVAWIKSQEQWSDLTFVLLTNQGGGIERNPAARRYLEALGNATFIERPFHPTTLISTVQSALRARRRQYEARARLEALRESETRLRLATENAEIGFWDVDPIRDVLIWPARVKAMFGISADVPVTMADFYDGLHPDDRDTTAAAYEAAADPRRRALYDVEYRTIGREDGVVRWVAAKGRGVFDEVGRCVRLVGTAIDVTQRKIVEEALRESEARLSFLDRLSAETAPLFDADVVMATTTRLLGEHLRLSVCAYADMDEDQDGFTIRGDWAAPGSRSIVGRYSLAAFGELAVQNLSAGLPLVLNDNLREIAPDEAATFQQIGIAATICMPLVKDGRLTALMAIHDRAPRMWTTAELNLLREVTGRSWAHVERVAAIAALRESELRFRLTADAVPQIIWITDDQGRAEFFNKQWSAYTGSSYEPSTAAELAANHVHPDDAAATVDAFAEARRTGDTFLVEHRIRSRTGSYRWFLVRGEPYRDPQSGEIVRWFGASVDIHDRKQAEAALRELNGTLEAQVAARSAERDRLWNLSQDLLARADYSGMMSAVSPAWSQVLGWGEVELLTRGYTALMHPEDRSPTLEAIARMAETRLPTRFENRIATRDGGWKHIEWTVAPEPDGVNFIAVGRDISLAKARQSELETAQEALRQAQKMEAMGQLTGGVAHDFNNLLTPIVGTLDMLQRRGLGGEREQRLIGGAAQSAERAKVLVQRLLAFARRQPLQAVAVDVAKLVENMADLVSSTTGPQIRVVVDVEDGLAPAKADPNQLEMALLNLAVNARDAMPDGGTLRISASAVKIPAGQNAAMRPGPYIRLSVADTGVGMDEATLARAVEPFFSTKGVGKGTGLGLSMAHGLASQLGGALTIKSKLGFGTNIEFWVPQTGEAPPAHGGPQAAEQAPGRGTALLVDDEEFVRLSTADMLGDLGYRVIEASSAEEALDLIGNGVHVDLVVTDHLMPGMSGTDLARTIRAGRPELPVLVVSGYAEVDGIASDLPRLTKPFRIDELAARLSALASSRNR